MRLTDALRLRPGMSVAFTGAGGKSSALEVLAREGRGHHPVVLTTTTRLASSQRSIADESFVAVSIQDARRLPIGADRPILVTGPELESEQKLQGLEPGILTEVARRCSEAGALLAIEADGARGRWVKAPAAHEPLVPDWVDVAVPVAGLPAVGAPLDPATAHRPERIAGLLGIREGDALTPQHLIRLLTSTDGGLYRTPERAEVRVLLTGSHGLAAEIVDEMCRGLLAEPRMRAVLDGNLTSPDPIRSATGRVAGVVLAAGAGERFGGPKPAALWKGRPLLAHVLEAARAGGLAPIVVVLGADPDAVRDAAGAEDVVLIENAAWRDGQSTSVQAGLATVESQAEAAVFLLADMPRVSPATIARLRNLHRASLASIVAPVGGGRRGNPVLFDRRVFPALHALTGDQGGRALIDRFPWQAIDVDPEEFAEVDSRDDLAALERTDDR